MILVKYQDRLCDGELTRDGPRLMISSRTRCNMPQLQMIWLIRFCHDWTKHEGQLAQGHLHRVGESGSQSEATFVSRLVDVTKQLPPNNYQLQGPKYMVEGGRASGSLSKVNNCLAEVRTGKPKKK